MINLNNFSIKNKLIAIILSTIFIVLFIGFGFVLYTDINDAKNNLVEKSMTEAQFIGEYCIVYLTFGDKNGAESILQKAKNIEAIKSVRLYNEMDSLFSKYGKENRDYNILPPQAKQLSKFVHNELFINYPIFFENEFYGTIVLRVSTYELNERIKKQILFMGALTLFLILLSFFIAKYLQKIISRPILHLVDATSKISKGDYSTQIERKGKDEIGSLIKGFNEMVHQINSREQELREKAAFINKIIDSTAVSTWISDETGTAIRANEACLEFFGANRNEIIGRYNLLKDNVIEEAGLMPEIKKVFERGEVVNIIIDYNLGDVKHIQAKNSGHKIINSIFTPVFDMHGNVVNVIVQAIDLTEIKQTEKELRRLKNNLEKEVTKRTIELQEKVSKLDKSRKTMQLMVEDLNKVTAQLLEERQKLELSNKELEAFTYSVSHDLRAPLRAINGFSKFLIEDYASKIDSEGKRFIKTIRKNAIRMDQLITDLLQLSRVSRIEMKLVEVNMETIVKSVFNDITTDEEKNDFVLNIEQLPKARCDVFMMKQIWQNLISNALKYSSKSKIKQIDIFANTENGAVIFCIKDYGAGFNSKYKDKLFGIFQRLHKNTEYEGTGVGLAIVQRLLHRQGGRIWADGQLNKGAKFCFSLPII